MPAIVYVFYSQVFFGSCPHHTELGFIDKHWNVIFSKCDWFLCSSGIEKLLRETVGRCGRPTAETHKSCRFAFFSALLLRVAHSVQYCAALHLVKQH